MVTFLANQNIDYAATSRRKAFLISTPREMQSQFSARSQYLPYLGVK
jgi:hypothetical protein